MVKKNKLKIDKQTLLYYAISEKFSYKDSKKLFKKQKRKFIRKQVYYALRNSYFDKKVTKKQLSTKFSKEEYKKRKEIKKDIQIKVRKYKERVKAPPKKVTEKPIRNYRSYFRWSYFAFTKEDLKRKISPSQSARSAEAIDGFKSVKEMSDLSGRSAFKKHTKIKGDKISKDKGGFHYIVYDKDTKEVIKEVVESGGKVKVLVE